VQYTEKGERVSSWFSFLSNNQWRCLLISLVILAISIGFFVWGTHVSDDLGGDSFVGLVLGIASMVFLFLAAVDFSIHRRTHKQQKNVGDLNAVLNWHICFAIIALVLVFLHAFGNLNPRTGTYALYGMIALVISGAIGRILDRLMPRFIAQEMNKALTIQGEDRIESISSKLQSARVHNRQDMHKSQPPQSRAFSPASSDQPDASATPSILPSMWDMAYISLETNPEEMHSLTDQYPFIPNRKSTRILPGALTLDSLEPVGAIEEIQQAFKREIFFRYIIRYWRILHIFLAVVTVGLTLWHIEYALNLIIPALQKFSFSYLLPWP
jgi:hypothetical protein